MIVYRLYHEKGTTNDEVDAQFCAKRLQNILFMLLAVLYLKFTLSNTHKKNKR